MRSYMQLIIKVLLVLVGLYAAATVVLADAVTVQPTAQVSGDRVRLADVAQLTGPEAERWAQMELAKFPARQQKLTLSMVDIRGRLADSGAHLGTLLCRGAMRITVHRALPSVEHAAGTPETAPSPNPVLQINEPAETANVVDAQIIETDAELLTVRDQIVHWIAQRLRVAPQDLRFEFDKQAKPILAMPLSGYRFQFTASNRSLIGRVPIHVARYQGDRLMATDRVRADVSVRRIVVTAVQDIARGQTIADADLTDKEVWIDRLAGHPVAERSAVVGRTAVRTIRAGRPVRQPDVASPMLVRRGDMVQVQCLSGAVTINTVARAVENGQAGQLIQVRRLQREPGERHHRTFFVRISGPQTAVMEVDAANRMPALGDGLADGGNR